MFTDQQYYEQMNEAEQSRYDVLISRDYTPKEARAGVRAEFQLGASVDLAEQGQRPLLLQPDFWKEWGSEAGKQVEKIATGTRRTILTVVIGAVAVAAIVYHKEIKKVTA